VYALSFLGSLPAVLVAAFTVRRLAAALGWERLLPWLAAGTAICFALPWLFARMGYLIERTYFPAEWQGAKRAAVFPFMGPMMHQMQPLAVQLAVAVATAGVFYLCGRQLAARVRSVRR